MKEIAIITEPKTLTEIVKVAPTLPTIRTIDSKELLQHIAKGIATVFEFYSVQLSDNQLKIFPSVFKEAAKQLTVPDIDVFNKHCLLGKYKTEYKPKLTPDVYLDWLKQYQYERMEAFADNNLKAKAQIEKQPIAGNTLEKLKDIASKLREEMNKPELVYSTDTSREEQQAKDLQKHLTKEFEYLWEKQGKNEFDRGRGKYVFHKQGSQMLPDYLRIRFKEIYDMITREYVALDTNNFTISLSDYIFEQVNKIIK